MGDPKSSAQTLAARLTSAADGIGPLLQRDYWAVVRGCRHTAPEVAAFVREHFAELAPGAYVTFRRLGGATAPLEVGDELEVKIRMAGTATVRVVHVAPNSVTLRTVEGHPETGRITFGAYPNERGDVIFHIRSRARSSSSTLYAGFLAAGESVQTNTWTDFIDCLAHTVGDGVVGTIQVETQKVDDDDDDAALDAPTFVAKGE